MTTDHRMEGAVMMAKRIVGFPELVALVGRGRRPGAVRMWIWRQTRAGRFPVAVRLGPNSVGWYADEIEAWVAGLPRAGAAKAA